MRYCFLTIAILCSLASSAQDAGKGVLDEVDLHQPTYMSPYYFGPNAFPVPDMLDGTVRDKLYVELTGDYFHGQRGDNTQDLFIKASVPLFTKRANLTVWMPVVEHCNNTLENLTECRVYHVFWDEAQSYTNVADLFISAEAQVLLEKKYVPAVALRACLKTASSCDYYLARHYDSPGYFFDVSAGKDFTISQRGFFNTVRLSVSGGFLCWQTGNGRQNDAIMYGVQAAVKGKHLEMKAAFGGYSGWEHTLDNGTEAHDEPMSLKLQADVPIKAFHILAKFQKGLRDYPYTQYSIGCAYDIKILKD